MVDTYGPGDVIDASACCGVLTAVVTDDNPGEHSWEATAETAVLECYGAGATGASAPDSGGVPFGGGGGGGYGTKVITGLTIGNTYTYQVGEPDTGFSAGHSWFISEGTVCGFRGSNGGDGDPTLGGAGGTF